ncbi:hypothetical protein Droror1_Dr00004090 [Drosera rotundifolia]
MDQKREPSGPRSPPPSPKRPRPPNNPGQGSQPSPTQAPRPMNPTGNPPAPPGSGNAPSNMAPTAPPLGSFAAMVGSGGISLSALVDDINELQEQDDPERLGLVAQAVSHAGVLLVVLKPGVMLSQAQNFEGRSKINVQAGPEGGGGLDKRD